ncbi:MAG: hypothetical protein J6Y87_05205 [Muribaculaceae bacterium]|nr:hypothetical protein [Muribaculaceae bacterium]
MKAIAYLTRHYGKWLIPLIIAAMIMPLTALAQDDKNSSSTLDMYKELMNDKSRAQYDSLNRQMDEILENQPEKFDWGKHAIIALVLAFAPLILLVISYYRGGTENASLKNTIIAGLILGAGILGIYATTIGWYYFAFHLGNQAQHLVFSIVFIALIVAIVIYLRRLNRRINRRNETENVQEKEDGQS